MAFNFYHEGKNYVTNQKLVAQSEVKQLLSVDSFFVFQQRDFLT